MTLSFQLLEDGTEANKDLVSVVFATSEISSHALHWSAMLHQGLTGSTTRILEQQQKFELKPEFRFMLGIRVSNTNKMHIDISGTAI